jgi:hypothetical protein
VVAVSAHGPRVTDVLEMVLGHPSLKHSGTWCEFGVYEMRSFWRLWYARRGAQLWGFDSFRGLPEDWQPSHPKGTFAVPAIKHPPEAARLVVGLFEETLPAWRPTSPITLVHIDCDLYSSTKTVLEHVVPHLDPTGAIMVFDDFLLQNGRGEREALEESGLAFRWLCHCDGAVAIEVGGDS